ncbi:PREDICTED: uncharacterized protein LOC109353832 [Lupinus angustifolius]|uniref:uncharacterized protein LOC109353832 n=1 Tax=Lupinus angustifolius TaxID=3871 RepID=UPI00092E20C3|nr:PREDICTED: uncharacterized protein LOC109353832 [Lupinus angustifolius]
MKVIFAYQEVREVVEEGYPELAEGATDALRVVHRENKKKDNKAMFFLHQCVDNAHFEKIASVENSREAWQILEKCNEGENQLKKVRLQTLRRQYELMQMEINEKVAEFFNRVIALTNLMKASGELITDQTIIEKILRTLAPKFDHIVVAIEESKNLAILKVEELQGSLEAHEQRMLERSSEKSQDQVLQAQTWKRGAFSNKRGNRRRGRFRDYRGNSMNSGKQSQNYEEGDNSEPSKGSGGSQNWRGGKRRFDRKSIRCFNCKKIGHFSAECKAPSNEANLVKENNVSDEEPVTLMMVANEGDNRPGV